MTTDVTLRHKDVTLLELLDRVLDKGVVVAGDLTISVADIDLVYLGLRLMLCSIETMEHMRRPSRELAAARHADCDDRGWQGRVGVSACYWYAVIGASKGGSSALAPGDQASTTAIAAIGHRGRLGWRRQRLDRAGRARGSGYCGSGAGLAA